MFKKPLLIAATALTLGTTLVSTEASAGDPGLGALLGGAIGAAIGHNVNGHNGAVVGGVLGALTGASIAANSGPYYDGGYAGPPAAYYPPAPAYVAPAPVYYAPTPVYYAPPAVVYRSRPVYVQNFVPRYPTYAYDRAHWNGHAEWRDSRGHGGHDGYDHRGH
jgi:hypothetical protein